MKTRITLLVLMLGFLTQVTSQEISLIFSASDTTGHVQLDSIKVVNRTQGGDTVLYWPDTVLIIDHFVGINNFDVSNDGLKLYQNYPNPVLDQTTITLSVSEKEKVKIFVTDIMGRKIISLDKYLNKGLHDFNFKTGKSETYFFIVSTDRKSQSIKILNLDQDANPQCVLNYVGSSGVQSEMKNQIAVQDFFYAEGDRLLYVGYAGDQQSGKQDVPIGTDTTRFYFGANMPCPGIPTINYGGQIYNTVQIFNQCWLKENLNVGDMLYVPEMPTNNDTIEKYCLNDQEAFCDILGGLYYWEEMMNYANQNGARGICPEGWHVPDDLDWQILEGAVDGQYGIGDNVWNNSNWRGSDAGGNLKQTGTTLWEPPNSGAIDLYDFTAIPGGYFVQGAFWGPGYKGYFWSSDNSQKYYRNMDWDQTGIKRDAGGTGIAFSVRCIKND